MQQLRTNFRNVKTNTYLALSISCVPARKLNTLPLMGLIENELVTDYVLVADSSMGGFPSSLIN